MNISIYICIFMYIFTLGWAWSSQNTTWEHLMFHSHSVEMKAYNEATGTGTCYFFTIPLSFKCGKRCFIVKPGGLQGDSRMSPANSTREPVGVDLWYFSMPQVVFQSKIPNKPVDFWKISERFHHPWSSPGCFGSIRMKHVVFVGGGTCW